MRDAGSVPPWRGCGRISIGMTVGCFVWPCPWSAGLSPSACPSYSPRHAPVVRHVPGGFSDAQTFPFRRACARRWRNGSPVPRRRARFLPCAREPHRGGELSPRESEIGVGGGRRRRSHHPGLRHRHQREPRWDGRVQGLDRRLGLPDRHLPDRLLRRRRRSSRRDRQPLSALAPGPARVHDRRSDGPRRLRELGPVRLMAGSGGLDLGRLLRAARPPRQRRGESHPVRRARRREPLRRPLQDLGHDLAGLQRLGREEPLRLRRGVRMGSLLPRL
jgi:hypothetical protein